MASVDDDGADDRRFMVGSSQNSAGSPGLACGFSLDSHGVRPWRRERVETAMKVLIADDDPLSSGAMQRLLKMWGYDPIVAANGEEAWEVLCQDDAPPLAIIDWMMPGIDGVELCQRLRNERPDPYVYVLMLTARGDTDDIVAAIGAGADEYLVKPFDEQELFVRLRSGKRILDIQQALHYKACHDPLTEVLNRAAVHEVFVKELSRANRHGSSVGIMMTDLDHFKHINDRYGHPVGDEVLREAVGRMQEELRTYDSIGRVGGEEFILVVPNCSRKHLAEAGERLRRRISSKPFQTAGGVIPVTVSIGVAVNKDWPDSTADDLVRLADQALYRAKASGRDRTEFADPNDHEDLASHAPGSWRAGR